MMRTLCKSLVSARLTLLLFLILIVMALSDFIAVIVVYLGVNYILSGLHSYM